MWRRRLKTSIKRRFCIKKKEEKQMLFLFSFFITRQDCKVL